MVTAVEKAALRLVKIGAAETPDWLTDSVIHDVVPSMALWLPVEGDFSRFPLLFTRQVNTSVYKNNGDSMSIKPQAQECIV